MAGNTGRSGSPLDMYMPRSSGGGSAGTGAPTGSTAVSTGPGAALAGAERGFEARPEQPVLMLDCVLQNGDRVGLPYAYLSCARLVGNQRLVLTYSDRTVEITGRNLGPLYTQVLAHTVYRVEAARSDFDDAQQPTRVESITVADRT